MGGGTYSVSALAVFNGELIAGGNFTTAGGVTCERVARWSGSAWQPLGSGMSGGTNPYVDSLTVYGRELIAGGYFTTAGGVTCNRIARWNGSDWQSLGSGVSGEGAIPGVHALTVYSGELIAGGDFMTAGEQLSAYWARWGPLLRGDLNGDGDVDMADANLFVAVLLGQDADLCRVSTADVDRSGAADGMDIQPFVSALLGG